MPFEFHDITTPSGFRYLLIDVAGTADLDDGLALAARLQPGQPHHRGYMLSRVAKGTEYSPQVRRFFPTLNDKYTAFAVVVTSPLVRAAINIMMRLGRAAGGSGRLFTDEDEALAWLENRARESRGA